MISSRASQEVEKRLSLRSSEFRRTREDTWLRLEDMINRVEKNGPRSLSASEAVELALLYRNTASSLSVARNIALDRSLLLYLENLTLRAYLVVYGPRTGAARCLSDFFTRGFPRAVRNARIHLAIAFAVLAVAFAAGYVLVRGDAGYFDVLIPEALAGGRGPESTALELMETELFAPWPGFVNAFVVFANSLFRHNAIVGIFCFGLGFAFGVPTIFLLAYNGAMLGAFTALHAEVGLASDFVAWVSIHGVTEILAILLCGAGGLVVAQNILFPGRLPRLDNLALYGREASGMVSGAAALFFVAGLIEGGFRQLIASTQWRYAFAAATLIFWVCYFTLAGRKSNDDIP